MLRGHTYIPIHPPQPCLRGYYYDQALSRVLNRAQRALLREAVAARGARIDGAALFAAARALVRLGLAVLVQGARGGQVISTALGDSFFVKQIFDPLRDCPIAAKCEERDSKRKCRPGCALETIKNCGTRAR